MPRLRALPRSVPFLGAVLLPAITRAFSAWMCVPGPLMDGPAGVPVPSRRRITADAPLPKEKQQ